MFYLEKISLQNFKNYSSFDASMHKGVNCIVGKNGIGKTNLLDAIYFLGFTKSAFNSIDSQLIKNSENHFILSGTFIKNDDQHFISTRVISGKKKEFNRNKVPIKKVSSFIGNYPMVMITPYDTDLIRDSSESRRKFIDGLISQINDGYLDVLLKYKNLIKQRNVLLKDALKSGQLDNELLAVLTEQLIPLAAKINSERKKTLNEFKQLFSYSYKELTSNQEVIDIEYDADIDHDMIAQGFKNSLDKDKILGRTNFGPHKDDLSFLMNGISVNKYASQGQQKSFIIALKLAQFNMIEETQMIKPILMLDDFFDRIDNERIENFADMLKNNKFGQVFITDSHPNRVKKVLADIDLHFIDIE